MIISLFAKKNKMMIHAKVKFYDTIEDVIYDNEKTKIITCICISLFLNKPLEYLGIENYNVIYKYIQLQRNRNRHND